MNKISIAKRATAVTILTGACAYAGVLGLTLKSGAAHASGRTVPSSDCHAAFDDNGSTVNNSGALTYTGTGTKSIFCPMIADDSIGMNPLLGLYVDGTEGTDGALTRACACGGNPITCGCATAKNWVNNAGGIDGRVASGVSTSVWSGGPAQQYGYILHTMTQNSSLAGFFLTPP